MMQVLYVLFQPQNLLAGSSYGQALNKDAKFSDEKGGSSQQRKGIQVHPDGKQDNQLHSSFELLLAGKSLHLRK